MEEIILQELENVLKLIENIDFFSTDRRTLSNNQKSINKAYSKLFDLVKLIELELGENE